MHILLVEDEELLSEGIKAGLKPYGYTIDIIADGKTADAVLETEKFDIIILDLGLPRMSGLDLLQRVRERGDHTPVLILTARVTVEDRVKGLNMGADDYLTKPFDLTELHARLLALLRRPAERAEIKLFCGNIALDPAGHSITVANKRVILPRREFALLQRLLEYKGQVLSREQLMVSLYGWDEDVDSNVLEVHIHNLRKKLNTNLIHTIRGVGYTVKE